MLGSTINLDLLIYWSAPAILVTAVVTYLFNHVGIFHNPRLDIPRIGESPSLLGNTSKGHFFSHSRELLEEGYAKYKNTIYSLWTTDMDRVIVSHKFMNDFNAHPRSHLLLTATARLAGNYTGMSIAEEGRLGYEVCAGQLSQNIGRLASPSYDEMLYTLENRLETAERVGASSTARVFVGTQLCRNTEWLETATGYTKDVTRVAQDLKRHWKITYPFVAPFLRSYRDLRARFGVARKLLLPILAERKPKRTKESPVDVLQWMLESAQGRDAEPARMVHRMLFLNMASIDTTGMTATNIFLHLLARPEYIVSLRQEIEDAISTCGGINLATLNVMKKTDSFMKEAQRMNPMGLMTFHRQLNAPVQLSSGVTLPTGTYLSMPQWSVLRDPEYFKDPLRFDGNRFYELRQAEGQSDKHQFSSFGPNWPTWAFGKFACPGRFWASAQIKLMFVTFLLNFDISYPKGQTERPENTVRGETMVPSATQHILLTRRK